MNCEWWTANCESYSTGSDLCLVLKVWVWGTELVCSLYERCTRVVVRRKYCFHTDDRRRIRLACGSCILNEEEQIRLFTPSILVLERWWRRRRQRWPPQSGVIRKSGRLTAFVSDLVSFFLSKLPLLTRPGQKAEPLFKNNRSTSSRFKIAVSPI